MQAGRSAVSLVGMLGRLGLCMALGQAIVIVSGPARADDSKPAKSDRVALGYEIFNREWLPDDPRSHGGDGLGPVYNDTSCVACHNSGGSGGAGPVSKNIDILNASRGMTLEAIRQTIVEAKGEKARSPVKSVEAKSSPREKLTDFHAGFRTSRTAVLHKFGTDPNYDSWRSRTLMPAVKQIGDSHSARELNAIPAVVSRRIARVNTDAGAGMDRLPANASPADRAAARIREIRSSLLAANPALRQPSVALDRFVVSRSQRNPTPLFGLGQIDAIPDAAIEKIAMEEARTSRDTAGRISRLKDGRIGRLGWKGQTASTEDFVLNACAVELGLEVPGHSQALIPQAPKYRSPGLDLNSDECAALVAYVRSLPAPVERRSTEPAEARHIKGGKALFASVGCTNCHAPKLGGVAGIYSDLLLHDMGSEMGDDGSYDPGDPSDPDDPPFPDPDDGAVAARQPASTTVTTVAGVPIRRGASKQEWRTPPLWGFRDSGPYLHDGRRRPSSRRSHCMVVRARPRLKSSSSSRTRSDRRSRRSSSRWSRRRRSNSPAAASDRRDSSASPGSAGSTAGSHAHECVGCHPATPCHTAYAAWSSPMPPDRSSTMRALLFLLMLPLHGRLGIAQEQPRAAIDGNESVTVLAFSPDGKRLATLDGSATVILTDTASQRARREFRDPDGAIRALAISPDSRTLATGGDGRVIRLWDLATARTRTVLKGHDGPITSLAFSRDGKSLASGSRDSSAMVWDLATGTARATLARHTSAVTSVAFAPDGKTLATGSLDWTAKVWDLPSGKVRHVLEGHRGEVVAVEFASDGKTLATSSRDGLVRLWDVVEGTERMVLRARGAPSAPMAFLAGVRALVTGGADGSLRRWDTADGHLQARRRVDTVPIAALCVSADGKWLATPGPDREPIVWDVAKQLAPVPFAGVEAKVRSLALSPDGKVLASASADRLVQLWDTASGRARGEPIAVESRQIRVAFSPDGKVLGVLPLGSSYERLKLWDPASGRELDLLAAEPNSTTRTFAFRPTAGAWPPRAVRSRSGAWATSRRSGPSRVRRAWSGRSPSHPTGRRLPPRAATGR